MFQLRKSVVGLALVSCAGACSTSVPVEEKEAVSEADLATSTACNEKADPSAIGLHWTPPGSRIAANGATLLPTSITNRFGLGLKVKVELRASTPTRYMLSQVVYEGWVNARSSMDIPLALVNVPIHSVDEYVQAELVATVVSPTYNGLKVSATPFYLKGTRPGRGRG
jgi:hypothetical protein